MTTEQKAAALANLFLFVFSLVACYAVWRLVWLPTLREALDAWDRRPRPWWLRALRWLAARCPE